MFNKLDPAAVKEIKHIALGQSVGAVIILAVYFGLRMLTPSVVYSTLIGALVALVGFIWLCFSVQKTVDAAAEGKDTKGMMTKPYVGRMLLYAIWVVCAIKFDCFDSIAGAVPILLPSLTIKIMNAINSSKKKEGENK